MTTLIQNCKALLMDEAGTILPHAFVAVEDTKIRSVGRDRPKGNFDQIIDGEGNVLMPGLVNAHTHVPMTLLRGYGGGSDLTTWLYQYIFPVEDKLDARAVRTGTQLALAELIASGVTTIADMYMFCETIAQEVVSAGLSANIARGMTLFEDFDPNSHNGFLEMKQLVSKWHGFGDGQILIDACIHGEYTSRPVLWEATAQYAKDHQLGMHVHVSETKAEHENCIKRYGKTPIQLLEQYGLWETRAIAAHCVWTREDDWAVMAQKGVAAVHNPVSNLKLGSGIAKIPEMKKAGVTIALGTDGVASNNSHDMFEEMKFAATLHNGVSLDPLALLPMDVLRMATADGAAALGRRTGQIAPGFIADLILVDFTRPNLTPCHSVTDNLVYSARGSDVVMNMARGQIIYKNGVFFTLDLERTHDELTQYALPLLFG
jgi:5-methylthioadenosine/S-adenosylhomocysteine deaminase